MPAVFNAANEIAVDACCEEQTSFIGIAELVTEVMNRHKVIEGPKLEEILQADQWARQTSKDLIGLAQLKT